MSAVALGAEAGAFADSANREKQAHHPNARTQQFTHMEVNGMVPKRRLLSSIVSLCVPYEQGANSTSMVFL